MSRCYPRIGAATPVGSAAATAPGGQPAIGLPVLALLGFGLILAVVVAARVLRLRPARPTPAPPR